MRPSLALYALMLALPALYVAGSYLQDRMAASAVLMLVAGLCAYLLVPAGGK